MAVYRFPRKKYIRLFNVTAHELRQWQDAYEAAANESASPSRVLGYQARAEVLKDIREDLVHAAASMAVMRELKVSRDVGAA